MSKQYPKKDQAIMIEWIVNGHTLKEVSDHMKISRNTVSSYLSKYLPYNGPNKITITLQSKINKDNGNI